MRIHSFFPMLSAFALCASLASAQEDTSSADLNVAATVEALANSGDPVVQVGAGNAHACALVRSGQVFCWGAGSRLGNGTGERSSVPVRVKRLTNIQQIAVGDGHTCALQDSRRVFCWGDNFNGQLGNDTFDSQLIRVRVKNATNAIHISAGTFHSCMIKSNGRVFCWGSNVAGQLGIGEFGGVFPTPERVVGSQLFTELSSGRDHTCALALRGRAFCWGSNQVGQLGREDPSFSEKPRPVSGPTRFIQVTTGDFHSCGLRDDGVPFCWGAGFRGQLGNGTFDLGRVPVPTRVKRLFDATEIQAGGDHACALRENKTLVCWGSNGDGELGDGTTDNKNLRVRVKKLSDVTDVSLGVGMTCATKENGRVFCWGANSSGQLGIGSVSDPVLLPSRVKRLGR